MLWSRIRVLQYVLSVLIVTEVAAVVDLISRRVVFEKETLLISQSLISPVVGLVWSASTNVNLNFVAVVVLVHAFLSYSVGVIICSLKASGFVFISLTSSLIILTIVRNKWLRIAVPSFSIASLVASAILDLDTKTSPVTNILFCCGGGFSSFVYNYSVSNFRKKSTKKPLKVRVSASVVNCDYPKEVESPKTPSVSKSVVVEDIDETDNPLECIPSYFGTVATLESSSQLISSNSQEVPSTTPVISDCPECSMPCSKYCMETGQPHRLLIKFVHPDGLKKNSPSGKKSRVLPTHTGIGATSTIRPIQKTINWKRGDLIGQGGFGKVHIGLNVDTGELMAVKNVAFSKNDPTFSTKIKQLQNEIEIMKPLNHPHIIKYFFTEKSGSSINIFMEYAPGGSLHNLLQIFGPLCETTAVQYTYQLLVGLAHLHSKGIVHRDIKCANLLLTVEGLVKLADFGASVIVQEKVGQLRDVQGTACWMAPEVLTAQGHSWEADIWSTGCTVMEMLTGCVPWAHLSMTQLTIMRFLVDSSNPISVASIEKASIASQSFLLDCLRRDPTERPTASSLIEHHYFLEDDSRKPSNGSDSLSQLDTDSTIEVLEESGTSSRRKSSLISVGRNRFTSKRGLFGAQLGFNNGGNLTNPPGKSRLSRLPRRSGDSLGDLIVHSVCSSNRTSRSSASLCSPRTAISLGSFGRENNLNESIRVTAKKLEDWNKARKSVQAEDLRLRSSVCVSCTPSSSTARSNSTTVSCFSHYSL